MPIGTASAKLKKNILFDLVKRTGQDICFQCGKRIEMVDELSVEHKIPYLDSKDPVDLFFNLDNIAYSHLKCNTIASRRKTGVKHPSHESYKRGCRCDGCKEIERDRRRNQRSKGIKT